jgi:tRNA (cytidine/uridine-2'-O-)-methyltransferase
MLHVVLVHPEIPPNTGNIIRLCANTGVMLHLIEPLGFPIDHAKMRRAGLDYHEFTSLNLYADWQDFLSKMQPKRLWALTTKGTTNPFNVSFADGDYLVFGSETAGLPPEIRESFPKEHWLRLPMRPDNRSLNLSNSVAIVVYEAWRQLGFDGAS